MSKPQHRKRDRGREHAERYLGVPPKGQGQGHSPIYGPGSVESRRRGALEEALRYLSEKPPRITLARQAIQAALDPAAPRWGD